MAGLNYLDNQYPSQGDIQSVGGTLNRLALSVPQLRLQAIKLQQQAALQNATRILREVQAKEGMSHAGLYDAQKAKDVQATQNAQDMAVNSQVGGQANMLARTVSGGLDTQESLGGAASMLRQQGLAPMGEFEMPRDKMADALRAITLGRTTQNATETASGAASLMRPTNIPQGGIGYPAIGDPVMGMPKPIDIAPNHVVQIPGSDPMMGLVTAPEASTVFNATQNQTQPPMMAQGLPRPVASQHLGSLISQLGDRKVGVDFSTPQGNAMLNEILSKQGVTNRVPYIPPQPGPAPAPSLVQRLFGGGQPAPQQPQGPVSITTKEQYMQLPSGTSYIGPDGLPATKK